MKTQIDTQYANARVRLAFLVYAHQKRCSPIGDPTDHISVLLLLLPVQIDGAVAKIENRKSTVLILPVDLLSSLILY
jgi:hypothetical protein